MPRYIKYIVLMTLHFGLYSCTALAAERVSPDEYYLLLENIEQSFIDNDFDRMSSDLAYLNKIELAKVPSYEPYFFNAVIDIENGNISEGKTKLDVFKVMLLVDSGHIDCNDLEDAKFMNIIKSKMCAEYYYSYYQNPSVRSQEKILLYWYLIHLAEHRYELL